MRVLKELEGRSWEEISSQEEWRFRLLNETLRTAVIRGWKNEQVLYEIFYRLNSGSVKLSPMELRMSLHPGKFLKFVIAWTENTGPLHDLLGKTKPDPRMSDVELAVRHLAFSDASLVYRGDLKSALDEVCIKYNDIFAKSGPDRQLIERRLGEMNVAIDTGLRVFERQRFCKKFLNGQYETRFNRAIFDIQVGSLVDPTVCQFALRNAVAFRSAFETLSNDNDFVRALETTTKSTGATYERFSKWYDAVNKLTGSNLVIPKIE